MIEIPNNQFDAEKFKARYGLTDADFSVGPIGPQWFMVLRDDLVLPDNPPIFDTPGPMKTTADYAADLIAKLSPDRPPAQASELADTLMKLTGELPPDRVVVQTVDQQRQWAVRPPLQLTAGTAKAGTAPVKLAPGKLMTHPEIGALEYEDDGISGHLYITVHVGGMIRRVKIV